MWVQREENLCVWLQVGPGPAEIYQTEKFGNNSTMVKVQNFKHSLKQDSIEIQVSEVWIYQKCRLGGNT